MKRTILYYLGALFVLIGFSLLGWGVGKLFNKVVEGFIIGLGVGFSLNSLILLRTYRRLLSFEKEDI